MPPNHNMTPARRPRTTPRRFTASDVAKLLRAIRRVGAGWIGRCPACDSDRGTLTIRAAKDGRVLLACVTGCAFPTILERAGLAPTQLFPARGGHT